ncbi:PfkB family carbohydrate kinase [Leifsonia sp. NPDC058230]|uniref:PfkB family carbohydrate kinase n=1 Tax=Leifsonia sp. NPDC058230 TaxID=3346391 RepID=UPI0036D8F510
MSTRSLPAVEQRETVSDRPRLVFTGNVIVDIVMTIDALPAPGGDTIASSSTLAAGGGYNVMVAAERDGLPVVFAGQYGTGPFGDVVRAALATSGVDVVQSGLPDADSGYSVALVDASTERTFVTHVGAEGQLTSADLERVVVGSRDIVYVSGYSLAHPVNAGSLPRWLESLPSDVRVITDPSPLIGTLDPDVLGRVLRRTDVFSVNAREAAIAGSGADLAEAASVLLGRIRPRGAVVVRDGAAGCWVAGSSIPGSPVLVPGFPVRAVDSNGAGDAHGGVLAAALSRDDAVLDAARRANAAAAIAVTRSGPATAPTSAEIEALLANRS